MTLQKGSKIRLNPAAFAQAQRLDAEMEPVKLQLMEVLLKAEKNKREIEQMLTKAKKEGLDLCNELETLHDEIYSKMRDAQPELKQWEFKISMDDVQATAEITEPRQDDGTNGEDVAPSEDQIAAQAALDQLLNRLRKGPPTATN